MISKTFLQIGNPFEVTGGTESYAIIQQLLVPIIIICVLGVTVWMWYSTRKRKSEYPPGIGRPLGWFDIYIKNNISLHGNVRKYDLPFMPDTKEYLREIDYMSDVIDDLEKFVKEKHLFVYEMRSNTSGGILSFGNRGKDITLVSTFPLESDEISYEEPFIEEGAFSTGLDRRRLVQCHKNSRYHDIPTPDGIKDVWTLSPIPDTDVNESKELGFVDTKEEFLKKSHVLQTKVVLNSEHISKVIVQLEMVAIAEKMMESKNSRIDDLEEKLMDAHDKNLELQARMDVYRLMLDEHKIVGLDTQPIFPERGEPWGWHIMFGIAPITGWVLFPNMTRNIEPWMGAAIGMGIIIGIRFMTLRGQRREDERIMAESTA